MTELTAFLSALAGIIVGAPVVYILLRTKLAEGETSKRRTEEAQDRAVIELKRDSELHSRKITEIDTRVKALEKIDPVRLATKLDTINSQLITVEGKLDKYATATEHLSANFNNLNEFLHNTHRKLSQVAKELTDHRIQDEGKK